MVVEFFEVVVGGFKSFHVLVTTTNYNPLTTTPKDTVNNIILEAREINFPGGYSAWSVPKGHSLSFLWVPRNL